MLALLKFKCELSPATGRQRRRWTFDTSQHLWPWTLVSDDSSRRQFFFLWRFFPLYSSIIILILCSRPPQFVISFVGRIKARLVHSSESNETECIPCSGTHISRFHQIRNSPVHSLSFSQVYYHQKRRDTQITVACFFIYHAPLNLLRSEMAATEI